jgi:hypothetical protein
MTRPLMRLGSMGAMLGLLTLTPVSEARIVTQFAGGSITFLAHRYGTSRSATRTNLHLGMHRVPPADEYVLDFWLKLQSGWLEGQGGKIAGLAGGSATTGCEPIRADGWSVRYMWEPMRMYLYDQDRRGDCGDSEGFTPSRLPVEQWTRLTQRVRVNTPGQRNGIVQVWVNGQQVYSRANLQLRGNVSATTARIDRVILQPFRGGADASWAVSRDTTMEMSTIYLLTCVPDFRQGTPAASPICGTDSPPAADMPPIPAHSTATVQQIWLLWDLELGSHAPPQHFVLTAETVDGARIPSPRTVPAQSCQALYPHTSDPRLRNAQYCTQVGCPPPGTYHFWMQAQYTEGISQPSNIATCTVLAGHCDCTSSQVSTRPVVAPPRIPPPPGLPQLITEPPPLSQEIPPLVDVDPATLHLQPIGSLPTLAIIPPIPASMHGT